MLYQQSLWRVNALRVMAVAACVFQYLSNTAAVARWLRRRTHRRLICSWEGLTLHESLVFKVGSTSQSAIVARYNKRLYSCIPQDHVCW